MKLIKKSPDLEINLIRQTVLLRKKILNLKSRKAKLWVLPILKKSTLNCKQKWDNANKKEISFI